jgi:hypothetical protein
MPPVGPRLVRTADTPSPDDARERVGAIFREHYAGLCGFVTRYVQSRAAPALLPAALAFYRPPAILPRRWLRAYDSTKM